MRAHSPHTAPGATPARRRWLRRAIDDQSGQAVVESVIVIPLMTFLILGVVQLVMIQHARIMTDYAAFNAARAGIVWNGDRWIMQNAALISLLPTNEALYDETDLTNPVALFRKIGQRAMLYQINRRLSQGANFLRQGAGGLAQNLPIGAGHVDTALKTAISMGQTAAASEGAKRLNTLLGMDDGGLVRIDILNPGTGVVAGINSMLNLPGLGGGFGASDEIDFDDFDKSESTRLTIRVRYMYMMRVPFANWVIHSAWLAAQAGRQLYGAIWRPMGRKGATGFSRTSYKPVGGQQKDDKDIRAAAKLADQGQYMLPLTATYSMRMQSNPYRTAVQQ